MWSESAMVGSRSLAVKRSVARCQSGRQHKPHQGCAGVAGCIHAERIRPAAAWGAQPAARAVRAGPLGFQHEAQRLGARSQHPAHSRRLPIAAQPHPPAAAVHSGCRHVAAACGTCEVLQGDDSARHQGTAVDRCNVPQLQGGAAPGWAQAGGAARAVPTGVSSLAPLPPLISAGAQCRGKACRGRGRAGVPVLRHSPTVCTASRRDSMCATHAFRWLNCW